MIGFVCIEVSSWSYHSYGSFFNSVAMTGFWFSGILLVFYLFHVMEKFFKIPWLKIELGFCAIIAVLYLIASCLCATFGVDAFTAASFFGFCAMVIYGFDAFLKYQAITNGEIAQGQRRVVQQQQTIITSPSSAYPA